MCKMKEPVIRFKGYTDDWEQRKLGELAEFNPKSTLPDEFEYVDLESVVGTEIIAHRKETKETAPSRAQRLAEQGDVFYQTVRPYQRNNCLFEGADEEYVFSTGYAQMRPHGDSYFLLTLLQKDEFVNEVLDRCTGTSYPAINSNVLAGLTVRCPANLDEQNKVGNYFKLIDNLIALHQRKCDELQKVKKYMLKKMFPKKGEKVPEIRFAGFTGDWEQRKLGKIADIVTGTTPPTKDKDNYDGDYMFVSPVDIQGNRYVDETVTTLTEKGISLGRKLRAGTSLFVSIGSTIGKVAQLRQEAVTNQQINAVIPLEDMNDDFVYTLLENTSDDIKLLSATQAVPIINKTTFSEVEVSLPSKLEQGEIGNYFSNLDNLITLYQRKHNTLKEVKKYMLQNMFPKK